MSHSVVNLAFYIFVDLPDRASARDTVESLANGRGLKGTILIGHEGLNAMIAGEAEACAGFEDDLKAWNPKFEDVRFKRSYSDRVPFGHLKVKLKDEIVTLRAGSVDVGLTAPHLPPTQFRDWLRAGEDMVVIDTRNDFEFQLGTFRGAINPETTAFNEFPEYVESHRAEWKDRKIVMFCTGGIRCEKATSWMAQIGIGDVYQIQGGVLNYFEQIEDAEEDWAGELFVFDERVALDTNLCETSTTINQATGLPIEGNILTVE